MSFHGAILSIIIFIYHYLYLSLSIISPNTQRIVNLNQDPRNTETNRHFEMAWYDFCSTTE